MADAAETTDRPALALLTTCQLMLVTDATVMNVALPSIQHSLHFSAAGLSWVVNAYTLAFGGLLLLGGRSGDILGHRRVFVAGITLFTVASLFGGFATSPGWLLLGRAAQGVGAAFAGPGSLALIATTFEEGPRRARALSVFAMATSVGMILGLVLGGILTGLASWRWVLFVNVPFGAAVAVYTPRRIPESASRRRARLDLAGALTSTAGMTLLVYGFIRAAQHGWGDGLTVAALVVALVLLAAFLVIEDGVRQPLMPLRLFADRDRAGAYAMRLLVTAPMVGAIFFLTLFVQNILGYGPLRTGFAFLPTTLALIAASRAVPKLLPRYGPRPIMTAGSVMCAVGTAWLTQASTASGYLTVILVPVVLFGAGMGLVAVAVTFVALSAVPAGDYGAASGLLQSMQQVGGSLGVAVMITAYATGTSAIGGTVHAFTAGVVFTVGMLATSLLAFRTLPAPRVPATAGSRSSGGQR